MNRALPAGTTDLFELLDVIEAGLRGCADPAALTAYLADRRTLRAVDLIHRLGTVAIRDELETAIATHKRRVRQEGTIPCPI